MNKLKKVKLANLTKETLKMKELSNILGGSDVMLLDGCRSYICSKATDDNIQYCNPGAVCTDGIR